MASRFPISAASQLLPALSRRLLAVATCHSPSRRLYSCDTVPNVDDVDVAVVGGGPVGLAIACGLAPRLRVLVLEAGRFPDLPQSVSVGTFSYRAVALSPASVSLLRRLGAWPEADVGSRIAPVRRMRVAESDSSAELAFDASKTEGALAYVTEVAPIVARLAERARAAGAALRPGARLAGFESGNEFSALPRLRLRLAGGGGCVNARLLIGCDGFASPVRRLAGIDAVDVPYSGHKAMVATIEISGSGGLNGEAFQRFLPSGPIALLPLPDSLASLVWCTETPAADRLLSAPDADFVSELNRCLATGNNAGSPAAPVVSRLQPDSRAAFPLGFMHANRYVAGRVALAGDAAHRLSPLAGQGMNLAFADAECLVRLLSEAADNGADPADPTYLMEYETERQRQVVPIAAVNEGLRLLYSLPSDSCLAAPLRLARSLGFRLTNQAPLVKTFLRDCATTGRIKFPLVSGLV